MISGCCSTVGRLIPLPLRDLYESHTEIRKAAAIIQAPMSGSATINATKQAPGNATINATKFNQRTNVIHFYTNLGRISLAALGALAFYSAAYSLGYSVGLCGLGIITGSIISIPATAIVIGSSILYYGVASLIHSIAVGAFLTIATEVLICLSGLFILESYRVKLLSVGIAESIFYSCTNNIYEKYYIYDDEDDDLELDKK